MEGRGGEGGKAKKTGERPRSGAAHAATRPSHLFSLVSLPAKNTPLTMALLATLLKVVMAVILPPLAVFLEAGACARGGERGGPGGREERGRGRGAPAPVTRGEMRGGAHLPSCRASTLTAPAPPNPPPSPPFIRPGHPVLSQPAAHPAGLAARGHPRALAHLRRPRPVRGGGRRGGGRPRPTAPKRDVELPVLRCVCCCLVRGGSCLATEEEGREREKEREKKTPGWPAKKTSVFFCFFHTAAPVPPPRTQAAGGERQGQGQPPQRLAFILNSFNTRALRPRPHTKHARRGGWGRGGGSANLSHPLNNTPAFIPLSTPPLHTAPPVKPPRLALKMM